MRMCYLLLFLMILSQCKQKEKQHNAVFQTAMLRNVIFSQLLFEFVKVSEWYLYVSYLHVFNCEDLSHSEANLLLQLASYL